MFARGRADRLSGMAAPKPDDPEQSPRPSDNARPSEAQRIIEAYAADLRELIEKLRRKLN